MEHASQARSSIYSLCKQSAYNRRNRIMAETWESLFTKQAIAEGHSQTFVDECLKYRTELSAKNMPVIYDMKHLANLIGWSVNGLKYVLYFIDEHYTTYEIRKKSKAGGTREITAPSATMKQA